MASRIGPNRVGRAGRAALGVAALALLLAACSGGATAAGSTASAVSTAHDVPSGTQLKSILLATADVPADFAEESIGAQNSGKNLSAAAATVNLGSADCNTV